MFIRLNKFFKDSVILLHFNPWGHSKLKIHYWNCDVNNRAFFFIILFEFEWDIALLVTLRKFPLHHVSILIYKCLRRWNLHKKRIDLHEILYYYLENNNFSKSKFEKHCVETISLNIFYLLIAVFLCFLLYFNEFILLFLSILFAKFFKTSLTNSILGSPINKMLYGYSLLFRY